jgi:hypothetical protein
VTTIQVRSADDSDVEAMASIYVNAARGGWAHIFDVRSLEALKPPVDRLRSELAFTDPRQQLLVADMEGRVIAFAVVRPCRDEDVDSVQVGELDQFYCDPPMWGQAARLATAAQLLSSGAGGRCDRCGGVGLLAPEAMGQPAKECEHEDRVQRVEGSAPTAQTR